MEFSSVKYNENEWAGVLKTYGISGDGYNTPLGIDTNIFTPYNETVIWSAGGNTYSGSAIHFSEPVNNFERLRFIHITENPFIQEYGPPTNSTSYFLFNSLLSNTNTSFAHRFHLYKFTNWSNMELSGTLTMSKPITTTALPTITFYNNTQTATWVLNGYLREIRGINRKV